MYSFGGATSFWGSEAGAVFIAEGAMFPVGIDLTMGGCVLYHYVDPKFSIFDNAGEGLKVDGSFTPNKRMNIVVVAGIVVWICLGDDEAVQG